MIPQSHTPELLNHQFHFYNGMYDGIDALVLYYMIRHYKPNLIIEIGSGWSTRIAAQAAIVNKKTKLIAIEPYPESILVNGFPGLTSLMINKVEEINKDFFNQLGENDILFIDSSHIVKTDSDVNYLYLDVIPRLKKGVIIHIHDIFLPQEYPRWWIIDDLRFWNEQYLLQAFLQFNTKFQVLLANNYLCTHHLELVKTVFPNCPFYAHVSSFWMQRTR